MRTEKLYINSKQMVGPNIIEYILNLFSNLYFYCVKLNVEGTNQRSPWDFVGIFYGIGLDIVKLSAFHCFLFKQKVKEYYIGQQQNSNINFQVFIYDMCNRLLYTTF